MPSSFSSEVASLSVWDRRFCGRWELRCWCGGRGGNGVRDDGGGGGGGGSVEVDMSVLESWSCMVDVVRVNWIGIDGLLDRSMLFWGQIGYAMRGILRCPFLLRRRS